MNSMSARLFGLLLVATGLVWLSGMAWIYSGSRQELERVLDARLEEASRMVSSLIESADVKVSSSIAGVRMKPAATIANQVGTNFELACQIWSIDGQLVGRSGHAPLTQMTAVSSGFSNHEIGGTRWRVYAHEDRVRGIRVLVGDSISHRERLVRGLIGGLAVPGAIAIVLLSGLIWVAIREGLAPLHRLTHALDGRGPDELAPIDIGRTPREIRPVVDALNGLLAKVVSAREHERSVTAYAAHELRTPLAGLRAQMQIALAASDAPTRDTALKNAMTSVDRTTRMTRQLLALAKIEAGGEEEHQEWIQVSDRLRAIFDELRTKEKQVATTMDDALSSVRININPDAFHLAARNLVENAIQHSPPGGIIHWSLFEEGDAFAIALDDHGSGVPDDELALITQKFYRGRNKTDIGSGLGLSIAKTALEKDGVSLRIEKRSLAGLRACILIGKTRVTMSRT